MTDALPRPAIALGLRENAAQFTLLVVVNAFVGAMVGLERGVLPLVAGDAFGVASASGALSFIAAFGFAKAMANLVAGRLADVHGRRYILLAGWALAIPVPLIIWWAPGWGWVVAANVLLGVSQGMAWSMTVVMKIDLVGPQRRGLAMGLNEFAGYLAVGAAAFAAGLVATRWGLREGPALLGLAIAVAGFAISAIWVRETAGHAALDMPRIPDAAGVAPSLGVVLRRSLWPDARLFSASQAGLVNNLNDGFAWGIFPLLFAASGLPIEQVSLLAAIYPAAWGIGQLFTGALSDRFGRKPLIVWGMVLQGGALLAMARSDSATAWSVELAALGLGTAMVYPALLAAVSDLAHPSCRGSALGVYRLWRDLGYVFGAVCAGVVGDVFGLRAALGVAGILTALSGLVVVARYPGSRG